MKRPIANLALLGSIALAAGCQSAPAPIAQTDQGANQDTPAGATPGVTAEATPVAVSDRNPDTTAVLWVKGLACPYCVQNIDKQIAALPGVDSVEIDLPTGKVTVGLTPDEPATEQSLVDAIDDSGFTLDRVEMPGR